MFLFIFVTLVAVAGWTSCAPVRTPLLLNRPQTEEWKGWMQVRWWWCGGVCVRCVLCCCVLCCCAVCALGAGSFFSADDGAPKHTQPSLQTHLQKPNLKPNQTTNKHNKTKQNHPSLPPPPPPPPKKKVLFLLYHYFEAREAYNAIRIFIAGYVWLTGFGNFSYYIRSGDFTIGR